MVSSSEDLRVDSISKFKNRNRMEIIANLLNVAKGGTMKTHIMYKANLSYVMMHDYLEYLTSVGLILETTDPEGAKIFKTTDRGEKYLEIYSSLHELAGIESYPRREPRKEKERNSSLSKKIPE